MDLQKLMEFQVKMLAQTGAGPKGRGAAGGAVTRTLDVQQAQVDRVEQRIESLERRKAELVESMDAELAALRSEHAARTDRIESDRKDLEATTRRARAAPPPEAKKGRRVAKKGAAAAKGPKKSAAAAKGAKKARPSSPKASKPR